MKTILLAVALIGAAIIPARAATVWGDEATWSESIAIAEKNPGAAYHKTCVDETCTFALIYTGSYDGLTHAIGEVYVNNVLNLRQICVSSKSKISNWDWCVNFDTGKRITFNNQTKKWDPLD